MGLKILISGYIVGLLTMYAMGVFGVTMWDYGYYWWDAVFGNSIFGWLVVYNLVKQDKKAVIKPLVYFSIARMAWDVLSYFIDVSVNTEWGVTVLFLCLVLVVSFFCFREFKKLNKYL